MYLVDTNVVSAAAPNRLPPPELVGWIDAQSSRLWLSVVSVVEIEDGIAKLARTGATRRSADLRAWWDGLQHFYADRILPVDVSTARIAGVLSDRARGHGEAPGLADILIAATAQRRGLLVLTRNLRHLEPLGVRALDPFQALPPS